MSKAPPAIISVVDAAGLLGVSTVRVHQYISAGRLSASKIGNSLILNRADVLAFKPKAPGRPAQPKPKNRPAKGTK